MPGGQQGAPCNLITEQAEHTDTPVCPAPGSGTMLQAATGSTRGLNNAHTGKSQGNTIKKRFQVLCDLGLQPGVAFEGTEK